MKKLTDSTGEDTKLLLPYFSLPLRISQPPKLETRKQKLRAMIRINPDNSRTAKWRAELATL